MLYLCVMKAKRRFVLRPNRSFSRSLTAVLFTLLGIWILALGIFSWTYNAWPIVGLAGLELGGLALAFFLHNRSSRIYEEVILTSDFVQWNRHLPSGHTQSWQGPLAWTKIITSAPENTRSPLTLRCSGQQLTFGEFLSPEDRGSFAQKFKQAQRRLQFTHSSP